MQLDDHRRPTRRQHRTSGRSDVIAVVAALVCLACVATAVRRPGSVPEVAASAAPLAADAVLAQAASEPPRDGPDVGRTLRTRVRVDASTPWRDIEFTVREDWVLGPTRRALWGTWRDASGSAEISEPGRRPRAGDGTAIHDDGDFVLSRDGDEIGGAVSGLDGLDLLISPATPLGIRQTDGEVSALLDVLHDVEPGAQPGRVVTTVRTRPPQACDDSTAKGTQDIVWTLSADSLGRREPPRVVDVLVLYAPRALLECGGRRERLKLCLETAIGTANEAFVETTVFRRVGLLPVPWDCDGRGPDVLWRALRTEPGAPEPDDSENSDVVRSAPDVRRLAKLVGADVVLVVTGRPTRAATRRRGHGGPQRRLPDGTHVPALAVLPVGELRWSDQTPAHELGHALGLPHTKTGTMAEPIALRSRRQERDR